MKPRSMEEKISYLLFLMGFAGLACTAALCIFVFHKAFREQAWTALERETDLVAAGCAQVDDPSQLETYVDGSLRITLIASDGSVLFESATNQPMENHLSRPEIQQAMKSGVGRDCRDSQTLGYETYYYAMLRGFIARAPPRCPSACSPLSAPCRCTFRRRPAFCAGCGCAYPRSGSPPRCQYPTPPAKWSRG